MKEIHILDPKKSILILIGNTGNIRQESEKCKKKWMVTKTRLF